MKNSIMTDNESCANAALERPRYFARQMLTQAELTLEQNYFRDRLRRHNRLLHGWGVVCGANICAIPKEDQSGPEAWKVRITPGYILGPYGDEIVIDCERIVDLRRAGATGMAGESPVDQIDPWCSKVFVDRRQGPLYIAVKYKEIMTRPVRIQPIGCGCDDNQCEYSRWRDGYEIGILSECPDSHLKEAGREQYMTMGRRTLPPTYEAEVVAYQATPPPPPPPPTEGHGDNEPPIYFTEGCPACPSDPWVVLGLVQIDPDGRITSIDNCICRRIVPTFALLVRTCDHPKPIEITDVKAAELKVGATAASVEVNGTGFESGARVNLGSGVTIKQDDVKVELNGTRLTFKADVNSHVQPGSRTLTITNLNCSTATKEVNIGQGAAAAVTPAPAYPINTAAPGKVAEPVAQPATTTPATRQAITEKKASKKGRRKEEE